MSSKSNRDSIKYYNSDYVLNSCKLIALIVGLWPINIQNSSQQKIIKIILNFIVLSFMMLRFLFTILFVTFVLKNISQKFQMVGPILFQITNIIKYLLLLNRGKKIENCFKIIKNDWCRIENDQQRQMMIKNAQFGRNLIIMSTIFMYIAGLGYNVISPLMSKSIITHKNISVKPFPSPLYGKFFTSGESPIYEIIFSLQLMTGFFLYSVTPVAFSFVAMFTLHACSQFEIVIFYLNKLLNKVDNEKCTIHEKFVIIVNSHHRVISFVAKLEAAFTEICLIEISICTVALCLIGYYMIMSVKQSNYSNSITFPFLFTSYLFNLFIYCYVGELLVHKVNKVGENCYLIDWHLLSARTLKDLIFFLRCTQSSTKITAGKVIPLSLSTFGSVIKTAGAYCNALWNMSK